MNLHIWDCSNLVKKYLFLGWNFINFFMLFFVQDWQTLHSTNFSLHITSISVRDLFSKSTTIQRHHSQNTNKITTHDLIFLPSDLIFSAILPWICMISKLRRSWECALHFRLVPFWSGAINKGTRAKILKKRYWWFDCFAFGLDFLSHFTMDLHDFKNETELRMCTSF